MTRRGSGPGKPKKRRLEPFAKHKDHGWSVADGSCHCEPCQIAVVHPTEAELEERFVARFGMSSAEWSARYGPGRASS